jgi:hypothetical protein
VPFAFAAINLERQKERAFQASSPKTFQSVLRGGFFLFLRRAPLPNRKLTISLLAPSSENSVQAESGAAAIGAKGEYHVS